jgi:hypothetical protein
MAKRKKLTQLQLEYKKELNRLNRTIKNAEKRGYIFQDNAIPKEPKRITKQSIAKIKKIKPADLYKKSKKVDFDTGELISGVKGRKLEKQKASEKAKETRKRNKQTPILDIDYEPVSKPEPIIDDDFPSFSDIVISNFLAEVARFPEVAYPLFKSWIDGLLTQYPKDDIATMLEEAKSNGLFPDYSVAYRRDLVLSMIADMMDFLPNSSDWFKKDLAEKLEYGEDWETPD